MNPHQAQWVRDKIQMDNIIEEIEEIKEVRKDRIEGYYSNLKVKVKLHESKSNKEGIKTKNKEI